MSAGRWVVLVTMPDGTEAVLGTMHGYAIRREETANGLAEHLRRAFGDDLNVRAALILGFESF